MKVGVLRNRRVVGETHTQVKGGDWEVNTRAGEGMFPLGLVTMLFLVLFVWGCAGKERKGRRHNKSVNNSKRWVCV